MQQLNQLESEKKRLNLQSKQLIEKQAQFEKAQQELNDSNLRELQMARSEINMPQLAMICGVVVLVTIVLMQLI